MSLRFPADKRGVHKMGSYLDSVVHFAYILLRMLEKYSKNKSFMFVRKRRSARKKRKAAAAGEGAVPGTMPEEYGGDDEEDEEMQAMRGAEGDGPSYAEHKFTFESYERVSVHLKPDTLPSHIFWAPRRRASVLGNHLLRA